MTVEVVGGDAFLELHVPAGPHRRWSPTTPRPATTSPRPTSASRPTAPCSATANAVATAANESRFGTADRAPDPDAEPEWETVATDGTYAWHDHRIHWMSPTAPAGRGPRRPGRPRRARRDLAGADHRRRDAHGHHRSARAASTAPSPLPWVAARRGRRRRRRRRSACGGACGASAAGAIVVASAAVGVSWATWSAAPAGSGASVAARSPCPSSAVVAAVRRRVGAGPRLASPPSRPPPPRSSGWGLTRWTVLARAELPTTLPVLDRPGRHRRALGAGIGLAVLLVWRLAVRKPPGQIQPDRLNCRHRSDHRQHHRPDRDRVARPPSRARACG